MMDDPGRSVKLVGGPRDGTKYHIPSKMIDLRLPIIPDRPNVWAVHGDDLPLSDHYSVALYRLVSPEIMQFVDTEV